MNIRKKINVAIVGFGSSGSILHAPVILQNKGFRLVAIVSSRPATVRKQFPEINVLSDLEQLLRLCDLDLVVVATPNSTHYELVKKCLQQNKHVIIEKPMTLMLTEAKELIAIAKQKNRVLCTYQNRRWDGPIITLNSVIQSKVLGHIYQCDFHFDRYRPVVQKIKWKELNIEGGGALYDIAPHLIDHALCFFGMPESIQADIATQRSNAVVDDYFHIVLMYGKTRVLLHSSSVILGDVPHIQVHGANGSYSCYGMDGYTPPPVKSRDKMPGKNKLIQNRSILKIYDAGGVKNIDLVTYHATYGEYYCQIYEAIVNGAPQPVSFTDMLNNVSIMSLARKSFETNQRLLVDN